MPLQDATFADLQLVQLVPEPHRLVSTRQDPLVTRRERQRLSALLERRAVTAAASRVSRPRASSSVVGQAKPTRKNRRSMSNQCPPPTYVPCSSKSTR